MRCAYQVCPSHSVPIMLNEDLAKLSRAADNDALYGFEGAVWARIKAREEFARSRSLILRWQALAVVLTVMGSLAGGLFLGREHDAKGRLDAFSTRGLPAPSRLLLGAPA